MMKCAYFLAAGAVLASSVVHGGEDASKAIVLREMAKANSCTGTVVKKAFDFEEFESGNTIRVLGENDIRVSAKKFTTTANGTVSSEKLSPIALNMTKRFGMVMTANIDDDSLGNSTDDAESGSLLSLKFQTPQTYVKNIVFSKAPYGATIMVFKQGQESEILEVEASMRRIRANIKASDVKKITIESNGTFFVAKLNVNLCDTSTSPPDAPSPEVRVSPTISPSSTTSPPDAPTAVVTVTPTLSPLVNSTILFTETPTPTPSWSPSTPPMATPSEAPTWPIFTVDVPEMSTEALGRVLAWIKSETIIARTPFCWKDSYGRGVGTIPTECPGRDKIGALCYSKCPAGTVRWGFDCHSVCPSGWRDDGLFCRRAEYGRGAGYPWQFWDGFSNNGMLSRCRKHHGSCEMWGAVAYPKCKSGYSPAGCCICRPAVPRCSDYGLNDAFDLSCAKKVFIGDPIPMSCDSRLEYDAGLCYNKCNAGMDGVGPVCWGICASTQVDCGAACAASSEDCALGIVDQVVATLILAANVATLGLATPATAGAGQTIKVAGKVVAGTTKVGRAMVRAVNALQTVNTGEKVVVIKRFVSARTGDVVREVTFTYDAGSIVYSAQEEFRQAFADDFAAQTSRYIDTQIIQNFHPITANFVKGAWAEVELAEMAEAYAWQLASNALNLVSLVDVTGVTGVIAAFAKPICAAKVSFPCSVGTEQICI